MPAALSSDPRSDSHSHAVPAEETDLEEQDNATDPLLASQPFEKYADVEKVEEALPLASYSALLSFYALAFVTLLASARKDDKLPEKLEWRDFLIFSLAVFHLSRTLSKGWITIPLRAPFARYESPSTLPSEVHETARGKGLQRVVGELLTCPFCLGTWVGLGLGYGWVFAPRATRLLTGISAMGAASNFLHLAYKAACQKTQD